MSDVDTTTEEGTEQQVDEDGNPIFEDLSVDDIKSRGKGVKVENLDDNSPAMQAIEEFKVLAEEFKQAEASAEELKQKRNTAIRYLKDDHNVSFSSIAEIIGATSSLVLYLYERSLGKSAKQIREESQRSAAAKAKFQEENPNKSKARKQTPEEKAFRKQQREALKAFLAENKPADNGEESDDDDDDDDDI